MTRNGGGWRAMPHDLPPYRIVFYDFRIWQRDRTWERIHATLRTKVRQQAAPPSPRPRSSTAEA
ncbi:MAG: transposase [Planctomycetaceae bacterium]|nr:transposase [Planctomycetaceae bacterium]